MHTENIYILYIQNCYACAITVKGIPPTNFIFCNSQGLASPKMLFCKNYIFALKRYLYFKKTDKPLRRRLRSVALPLKKVYKPPALSQQTFTAYSRTFAGSAAIFHVLLTPGWGLYFFFSPAGAKPANRFGGDLKVNF